MRRKSLLYERKPGSEGTAATAVAWRTHMNSTFRLLILVLAVSALLGACADDVPAPVTDPGIGVDISSDVVPNVEVRVGEQITWTNRDDEVRFVRHVPDDDVVLFDSGELEPGDSFSFVFAEPGTFRYRTSEGQGVEGTVAVQP